jgi:tetraacyldisaccharide 4'-kinase
MSRSDAPSQWQAVWAGRGWRARLLWPLSLIYGALAGLRRRRFISGASAVVRLPVPVIVVGNVVVGGAGKTPTVLALLSHLKATGWQPGVVSRGHGRSSEGVLELRPETPAAEAGDEPTLIRSRASVPVFVGRQRAEAAKALLAAHPKVNVLVCDDGLQHLALGRDIGIAVFDDRGLGNGWLLPAGLLREPWPPAAGDPFAPQLVLQQQRGTGTDRSHLPSLALPAGAQAFGASRRLAEVAIGPAGQHCRMEELQDTEFTAVAGIARPEVFFAMLRERGLNPAHTLALPDHADNSAFDSLPRSPAVTLVCTEKDAVKLFAVVAGWPSTERPTVWAVPLELQIEPGFFVHIDRLLKACAPSARLSSPDGHQTA